jgi:hypothetical protein
VLPKLDARKILGNQNLTLVFGQEFCNLISIFGTVHCEEEYQNNKIKKYKKVTKYERKKKE